MRIHEFFPAVSDWTYIFNQTGEPSVIYNRALAYMGLNDQESGRKDLEQVLEMEPENMNAYYYMGLSYERSYEHRQAMKWWKDLLKFDPDDHRAQYQLAADLVKRGRIKKGCRMLATARENGYTMTAEDDEFFSECK